MKAYQIVMVEHLLDEAPLRIPLLNEIYFRQDKALKRAQELNISANEKWVTSVSITDDGPTTYEVKPIVIK